jgi:hypothetical protein
MGSGEETLDSGFRRDDGSRGDSDAPRGIWGGAPSASLRTGLSGYGHFAVEEGGFL